MKKSLGLLVLLVTVMVLLGSCSKEKETASKGDTTVYPAGTVTIYGHGQPQYLGQYFDAWLERNRDIAPEVTIEVVQTKSAADSREKITVTYLSGAYEDLPDAVYLDPVNVIDLGSGGLLKDVSDFILPIENLFVDGALNDATIDGKVYALPESVRPQVLFYNKAIFDEHGVDYEQMATMEGYINAGRELKEKSNGKVFLSYEDPASFTWRYYGRRGFMPQANARIWDENGEVVIDTDEGTALALGTLDALHSEGLLLKTKMFEPALYDAIRNHEVATFNIGAFWDEFLRKNVQETSGEWRVMSSPVFEGVGKAGAPVPSYFAVVNKPEGEYAGLVEKLWYDFHTDNEARIEWVKSMEEQNAPYSNPITLAMLEDPFWKEPSEFYGGQSFREAEGDGLRNSAANLTVTPQDAEADTIISVEIEEYIAGDQTIEEAIAAMGENLRSRIGSADIVK